MAVILAVLFMATGVALSIALHEVGHLVPAKRFGVRVPQYMVGFGPTMWSRHVGETEYGVKAVPLGGYVRMIGMYPPRPGDAEGTVRVSSTGRFSQLMDEARSASLQELQPGDDNRVFYKLTVPRKLAVMLGGPTMNLLIAVVLMTFVLTAHGFQVAQPGAVVAAVSECVVPAAQAATTTTCTTQPKTPAYLAGLKPGDSLVSINGQTLETTVDVGALIRPRVGQATEIVLDRAGERLTVTATPIRNTLPQYDDQGNPVLDASGQPVTIETGFLGIQSAPVLAYERQPLSAVPGELWNGMAQTAAAVVRVPERMVGVWQTVFAGEERSVDSPMSVVGVGRIAGEIGSGRYDALIGTSWVDKFFLLVSLLAGLNFMLFFFNLLPMLPLDGGHVVGALWEGLKRQVARLLSRPDPGYVDMTKGLPVAYVVSVFLIGMTLLLAWADLVAPIKLGG